MANTFTRKLHALFFPVPYQGHVTPSISLATKLASKGFAVTLVLAEHIHHSLTKSQETEDDLFSEARKSGLDIRCCTITDGFPLEFDRLGHFDEYWTSMLKDYPARVDEFIGNTIGSDSASAFFLLADCFFEWSPRIANKYDLVNVTFFTQPALVFALGYHMDLLTQHGHVPLKENMKEEIDYIPGVDTISTEDLMAYFKEELRDTSIPKVVLPAFHQLKNADFVLHNTIQELESKTLETLSKNQPTYAIGPIHSFTDPPQTAKLSKSLRPESDFIEWLESKPPGSALYVSFGSIVQTSKQVIQEIAYGLLQSEVNFVWAVRDNILTSGDSDIFPDGFEDKIKDRVKEQAQTTNPNHNEVQAHDNEVQAHDNQGPLS